jgi:5-carboxymethyl-2-hydroxymuconate isomerase
MPHLRIEHSANLAERTDLSAAASRLRGALAETGLFPMAGIRVRCLEARRYEIADGHPANAFAHLELRVGAGREPDVLRRAGQHVFDAAQEVFARELTGEHFALSLEIVEIEVGLSWKANGIRHRLNREGKAAE